MKVILPVINGANAKSTIARGFNSTDYVCIYDCDEKKYEWLTTNSISNEPGNLSLELKRIGVSTVISSHMPLMALGLFVESGLKVYRAVGLNVETNIHLFQDDLLQPFTPQTAKEIESCSSSCGTCNSNCN